MIPDGASADALQVSRLIPDPPTRMRELSVSEQRYKAVLAVVADAPDGERGGEPVGRVSTDNDR